MFCGQISERGVVVEIFLVYVSGGRIVSVPSHGCGDIILVGSKKGVIGFSLFVIE